MERRDDGHRVGRHQRGVDDGAVAAIGRGDPGLGIAAAVLERATRVGERGGSRQTAWLGTGAAHGIGQSAGPDEVVGDDGDTGHAGDDSRGALERGRG